MDLSEASPAYRQACWLALSHDVNRYLIANAEGRWDGAAKARHHIELCTFMVASWRGIEREDVELGGADFDLVHRATQELTDNMDEQIGFPLAGRPDYDRLAPLFFAKFFGLACTALCSAPVPTRSERHAAAAGEPHGGADSRTTFDALRAVQEMWDELERRKLNPILMRRYSDAIGVLENACTTPPADRLQEVPRG
jgi:hypothetical protein